MFLRLFFILKRFNAQHFEHSGKRCSLNDWKQSAQRLKLQETIPIINKKKYNSLKHNYTETTIFIQEDKCQSVSKNPESSSFNLRSGSIFVSLWKLHSGGQRETKRELDTNLLRNVCRPLFWLIDICRISQSKLLPLLVFLVCKFFTRGKNADWLTLKKAFIRYFFQLKIKTVSTILRD